MKIIKNNQGQPEIYHKLNRSSVHHFLKRAL